MRHWHLGDIIIVIILFVLSFSPFYFLLNKKAQADDQIIAIVKARHHTVKTFNLSQNATWTYRDGNEYNIITVKNHHIRISEANCRDQVCVKEGWKSHDGQTLVCLPHQLIIELKARNQSNVKHSQSKDNFDHTLVNP